MEWRGVEVVLPVREEEYRKVLPTSVRGVEGPFVRPQGGGSSVGERILGHLFDKKDDPCGTRETSRAEKEEGFGQTTRRRDYPARVRVIVGTGLRMGHGR